MLYKKHLLIICSFFSLIACEKEVKTSFSEINFTTENNKIVEINIPEAVGNKAVADNINSEIQKPIIAALHIGDPNNMTSKSIEESITAFNNEYISFKTDFPETAPQWEAQIDGEIMFQSPEIISIAITTFTNTGGAHGSLRILFLNFNAQTGTIIKNDTLFNNISAFKTLANSFFNKSVEDKNIQFESTKFQLPENIGYNEEGVVLLYNTYEIAPYTTDIIEFSIPFEDAKPYLVFNNF